MQMNMFLMRWVYYTDSDETYSMASPEDAVHSVLEHSEGIGEGRETDTGWNAAAVVEEQLVDDADGQCSRVVVVGGDGVGALVGGGDAASGLSVSEGSSK